MQLGFFQPVIYRPGERGLAGYLQQGADWCCSSGKTVAHVIKSDWQHGFEVKIVKNNPSRCEQMTRLAAQCTLVLPLFALAIKSVTRCRNSFLYLEEEAKVDNDRHYNRVLENAGIDPQKATALQKHAVFFADPKTGDLRWQTVYRGLRQLHFSVPFSLFFGVVIFKGVSPDSWVLSLRNIKIGKHPADTGIYDQDGNFVEAVFKRVVTKDILTAEDLKAIRLRDAERDKDKPGCLKGRIAAIGEFDLAIKMFPDRIVIERGKMVSAISASRFEQLLQNSTMLFDQVVARKY